MRDRFIKVEPDFSFDRRYIKGAIDCLVDVAKVVTAAIKELGILDLPSGDGIIIQEKLAGTRVNLR